MGNDFEDVYNEVLENHIWSQSLNKK
jgi:hypothetical protein